MLHTANYIYCNCSYTV